MATITQTPFTPWEHRSDVYGGRSTCGTWTYYMNSGRCEVTHLESGRRFWALDIDRGRETTADPEFVKALLADPPASKPLNQTELNTICGELTTRDARLLLKTAGDADIDVQRRVIDLNTARMQEPVEHWHANVASKAVRTVYRIAPTTWLRSLRVVRPDLVPARHRES